MLVTKFVLYLKYIQNFCYRFLIRMIHNVKLGVYTQQQMTKSFLHHRFGQACCVSTLEPLLSLSPAQPHKLKFFIIHLAILEAHNSKIQLIYIVKTLAVLSAWANERMSEWGELSWVRFSEHKTLRCCQIVRPNSLEFLYSFSKSKKCRKNFRYLVQSRHLTMRHLDQHK